MAYLAGIDEAGYGPLLGPLVVSTAVFEVPEALLPSNLWTVLSRSVSPLKKTLHGRLLINDSKKAYTGKNGLAHLKRTVLASLLAAHSQEELPRNVHHFLRTLCPRCVLRLDDYPWYADLERMPLDSQQDLPIAAGLLKRNLEENGMAIRLLQARCLDVQYYNQRVESVKNKSRVLFTELCSLIDSVFQFASSKNQPVHFLIDRQGGRLNYRPELQRMFPEMDLTVLKAEKNLSSYELKSRKGTMRLHFAAGADEKFLPVAMASMTSKLIRELLIECLNVYYSALCGGLKPTAGYWQDGQRFINDLSCRLPASALPKIF